MSNEPYKRCSKCGVLKPVSEFTFHKNSKDGYSKICRDCLHVIKTESMAKYRKVPGEEKNNPLSIYTPRQLMVELRRRGYEGELLYTQRVNLKQFDNELNQKHQ